MVSRQCFTLKSDQEPAILSLKTAASRHVQATPVKEIVMEDSSVGESQARGLADGAVRWTRRSHSILEMGSRTAAWGRVGFRQPCGPLVGAAFIFDDPEESSRLDGRAALDRWMGGLFLGARQF